MRFRYVVISMKKNSPTQFQRLQCASLFVSFRAICRIGCDPLHVIFIQAILPTCLFSNNCGTSLPKDLQRFAASRDRNPVNCLRRQFGYPAQPLRLFAGNATLQSTTRRWKEGRKRVARVILSSGDNGGFPSGRLFHKQRSPQAGSAKAGNRARFGTCTHARVLEKKNPGEKAARGNEKRRLLSAMRK